ncbi:3'-5' exonuclease [Moraxella ovis]|uniref:3'-5' exonuclease n=1 Tax=Moraxella ovis TaxID=29433 RepID=UPI000D96835C|nr:3'-5' exonuclease [Moraxella ovis]SPX81653.1 Predicted 3'-5' exonuclease related to the exonuclease domain of PolB [Moraxella ovis]STZ05861.1 Predicted 3'-5' exonuclease related to the exonuclease domain of PolB [Moraxella ovis]
MNTASPILVFDIETIPDVETGRRLYPELKYLSDDDALTALIALRQAEAGNDFMRLPLHKIACLSFLWVENGEFSLHSLALDRLTEADILRKFFRAFAKKPVLVSWNGSGFDVPVLLYRALHHKISAPALFNSANKPDYLYRYGEMHVDLMDKMSLYNGYSKQKLDTIAALCGFAGKGEIDGSQVVPMVQSGDWQKLTTYCESDVLNTWLIYLRWLILTGKADLDGCEMMIAQTHEFVSKIKNPDDTLRHERFLDAWQ